MQKRTLSLVLALILCLELTIPASAVFPNTWEESQKCYTFKRQGSEATVTDALAVKLSAPLNLPDTEIDVYNLASRNTTWKLENVNPADDVFLVVDALLYRKDESGQYIPEQEFELLSDGRFCAFSEVDTEDDPDMAVLRAGESVVFGISGMLDYELREMGAIDSDTIYLVTVYVSDSDTDQYYYTNYYYKLDDTAVAAAISSGGVSLPNTVSKFSDVKETDYFADAVQWAVEKDITSGTSKTTFSPNNTCSNAEILTFLWRANGSPEPTAATPFTDVKTADYFYKAALWAAEKGLVSGSTFGANADCTRAMTVEYMWKAAGSPAPAGKADFDDVPANADYAQAVAWAVEKNITSGTGDGTFSPAETCTRGQIVTFLYRAMGK